jgi:hypothetical protein
MATSAMKERHSLNRLSSKLKLVWISLMVNGSEREKVGAKPYRSSKLREFCNKRNRMILIKKVIMYGTGIPTYNPLSPSMVRLLGLAPGIYRGGGGSSTPAQTTIEGRLEDRKCCHLIILGLTCYKQGIFQVRARGSILWNMVFPEQCGPVAGYPDLVDNDMNGCGKKGGTTA